MSDDSETMSRVVAVAKRAKLAVSSVLLRNGISPRRVDAVAQEVLAELANCSPPLLVCEESEVKDGAD